MLGQDYIPEAAAAELPRRAVLLDSGLLKALLPKDFLMPVVGCFLAFEVDRALAVRADHQMQAMAEFLLLARIIAAEDAL